MPEAVCKRLDVIISKLSELKEGKQMSLLDKFQNTATCC